MQTEVAIEIDCASGADAVRGRSNRELRPRLIVRLVAEGNDDVQCIGGTALKKHDQRLAARQRR